MPLVPKFVADLFAIAASVRHLHGEYLAAEVKRQRMKEIVRVMQGRCGTRANGTRPRSSASRPSRQVSPPNYCI